MFVKEKILIISIYDPNNPKDLANQKANNMKHGFMFSPPLKRKFDFLGIHLVMSKTQQFFKTSFIVGSFVLGICFKISKSEYAFVVWFTHSTSNCAIGCK
jgi:hypothetical protein